MTDDGPVMGSVRTREAVRMIPATLGALVVAVLMVSSGLNSAVADAPVRDVSADSTTTSEYRPAYRGPTAQRAADRRRDTRLTRPLYVDPTSRAAQAGAAFSLIGKRAQGFWLTDAYPTPTAVRSAAAAYIDRAEGASRTPVLVVYNIPDRDCGQYSSQNGQVTASSYRAWVRGVAAGIKRSAPIVILEPDALPFVGDPRCTDPGNRVALLKFAATTLTKAGAWVYLDAGHSGWRTAAHMAPLLMRAGVAQVRGFSTNVSNSRSTPAEHAFAGSLLAELQKRGARNARYVIDTSRNGAGAQGPANGDWCNPVAARLGTSPRLVFDGAFDGRLWIKPPGESDGPCNGGPNAGEFFPTGACRLLSGPTAYFDGQVCRPA